jgi:TRAP-type C4-dicarboxylate transport system permease small subunit
MMWVYAVVFIFGALWFTHYLLFALKEYRELKGEGR